MNNPGYFKCWFCDKRLSEDNAVAEVNMYGNVQREYGVGVRYETTTLRVPRCSICKLAHTRRNNCKLIGIVFGIIVGFEVFVVITSHIALDGSHPILLSFLAWVACFAIVYRISLAIGLLISPKGTRDIKSENSKAEFSCVLEMKKQGWKFSEPLPW